MGRLDPFLLNVFDEADRLFPPGPQYSAWEKSPFYWMFLLQDMRKPEAGILVCKLLAKQMYNIDIVEIEGKYREFGYNGNRFRVKTSFAWKGVVASKQKEEDIDLLVEAEEAAGLEDVDCLPVERDAKGRALLREFCFQGFSSGVEDCGYEYAVLMGVLPQGFRMWIVPRSELFIRATYQHSEDYRWVRFPAEKPPLWLDPYGGPYRKAMSWLSVLPRGPILDFNPPKEKKPRKKAQKK